MIGKSERGKSRRLEGSGNAENGGVMKADVKEVLLAPMRTISPTDTAAQPFRYGSLFCGVDVLREAWPSGDAGFTIDECNRSNLVGNRSTSKTNTSLLTMFCVRYMGILKLMNH